MNDSNDVDYISGAIAQAQAKIEELQAAIKTLESLRSLVGLGGGSAPIVGGTVSFGHDSFFNMTVADAAKKYLTAVKKTAPVKVIADALVAGGLKSSSKNVPENVRAILSRNPAFVVINGEFGLREWYPGRRVLNRGGRAVAPVEIELVGESPDERELEEEDSPVL